MVRRKLRKGAHGYLNIQIPQEFKNDLGWQPGDLVKVNIRGKSLVIEKHEVIA